ncbi:unnamed protein product [marine sediment metagenome]|uniref:N-acetyltransferase domain-containing protein n=1 Tax=marine sediment metagenome TaxID=412755 RepID=X0T3J4_9ZZZZ
MEYCSEIIVLRDATQKDLEYVRQYPINPEVTKHFEDVKIAGWAKTGLINNQILGVGGIVIFWPGVGEGWYALSEYANTYKIAVAMFITRYIDIAVAELKLHRFQTTIRADFRKAIKLIEVAGLVREGTMLQYTEDKKDAHIYAKLF